jgi:protein-disulfide isomerase
MHPASCEAAKVTICANKMGKFKEIYTSIFEHQEQLKPGLPTELAEKAGLDPAQLKACLESPETKLALERDIEEGIMLDVQGTPTFFFNGHKSELMPDLPTFSRAVEIMSARR